jgi:hypothetical protein
MENWLYCGIIHHKQRKLDYRRETTKSETSVVPTSPDARMRGSAMVSLCDQPFCKQTVLMESDVKKQRYVMVPRKN